MFSKARHPIQVIAVCALLLATSACATLTKEQCEARDWKAYGQVDGAHGRSLNFVEEHARACASAGIEVDHKAYEAGWRDGVNTFCTPETGYRAGITGAAYQGVCQGSGKGAFLENYQAGRDVYLKRARQQEIQKEIAALNEKDSQENKGTVRTILDGLGMSDTAQRISALRSESSQLSGEIEGIESRAPAATSTYGTIDRADMANGVGAYVGSFFGFGIGHAIQGRYGAKGWIYTASEAGAVGMMVGASKSHAATFAGLCALLGLKIWEATDLFSYAYRAHEGYPHLSSARIVPLPAGASLALSWEL